MADYHILEASDKGDWLRVAMHISIPAAITNIVGTTYRQLIAAHEETVSVVPDIEQVEADLLAAGALYEQIITFRTHSLRTEVQNRERLDALYGQMVDDVRDRIQRKYAYYGYSRDVT